MLKWLKRSVGGGPRQDRPDRAPLSAPRLTLTDPATIAGFQALASDLRQRKPVCPLSSGGVLLLDPDDVKSAFSNKALVNAPSRFSALAPKNRDRYTAASVAAHIPPFLDAPRHVEIRQWLSRAFHDRMRTFAPKIAPLATAHCERLRPGMPHLLVEEVARAFVVDTIGRFVGIRATPAEMKTFTSALFRLFAPAFDAETFAATNEGLAAARTRLVDALHTCRADGTEGLLSLLDQSTLAKLDEAEKDTIIADNALLMLADGVENVEAAIGLVMMAHATDSRDITEDTVRAILSEDTPGQTIPRIASQDMRIGDERLTAGTPVFLSLASANAASDQGEDFTFGRGRHRCIGEQLAVAMITTFCHTLAARQPLIDVSNLSYQAMFGHKWPRGVTIELAR